MTILNELSGEIDLNKQRTMELLAPAGDRESLMAALAAGADAVYLGGKLFNARRSAANFDTDQMKAAVELLHLHGKKLYVTVNTLILDSELEMAVNYLAELYNLGADAIIIQDLGLISLARKYLPDLELHASTQMTIHNSEGVRFLKELGLKRVVLSRELSRDDVAEINAKIEVETEVFVHGALCVCYSGQCLLSSMIGGRSGNRGRCAQPCRMEYQLIRNGQPLAASGTYLLSPKDLALLPLLGELDRAGVASLKIEGRMKRPEYVLTTVQTYRRALDRYYENPEAFRVDSREMRELEESFNRGFTTGYFAKNRNATLMNFNRPNNRGVFLGRVAAADHATLQVTLKLEADLAVGDGVEIWVSRGGRGAETIKAMWANGKMIQLAHAGMTVNFAVGGKAFPGDRVFKVFSQQRLQQTRQAVEGDNLELQIGCEVEVRGSAGEPLEVIYRDQTGHEGRALTVNCLEIARNKPLTEETLREHLGRLGNTPYFLQKMTLKLSAGLMMSFSDLNQVRREAVEKLQQSQLAHYRRPSIQLRRISEFSTHERRQAGGVRRMVLSVWAGDLDSVKAAVEAQAAIVYAGGDELTAFRWSERHLQTAIDVAHAGGAKLILGMPRLNLETQKDLWLSYYRMLNDLSGDGLLVSDWGALNLVLREPERRIFLNTTLNFFNSAALRAIGHPGIEQIAVSPELTLKQIGELNGAVNNARLEAVVQGPLELMISEYCPISAVNTTEERCQKSCQTARYALRDRMNLDFPLYTDQFCRMHLFNSKDHCLYGDLDKLARSGLAVLRLELKTAAAAEVGWITGKYHQALEAIADGNPSPNANQMLEEFKSRSGGGITKGHFFRGVD